MNTIRTISSIIRANPQYALAALALDTFLGLVAGIVAYVLATATGLIPGIGVALVLNFLLFASGLIALYVAFAISRGLVAETDQNNEYLDIEFGPEDSD